jgi:NitT/TauT family transport system ATP-binding protein
LHRSDAHTVIFVTHDVEEAAFLADRVIIFSSRPARVLNVVSVSERLGADRPLELRDSPEFFALRTELLRAVRASAEDEE